MKILSKQQFDYEVASIGGYVDQVGGELLSKALIGGTTARYVNVRLGIKGTQALNLLNSNVVFQDGVCGWDPPTGTTTTFIQGTQKVVMRTDRLPTSTTRDDVQGNNTFMLHQNTGFSVFSYSFILLF